MLELMKIVLFVGVMNSVLAIEVEKCVFSVAMMDSVCLLEGSPSRTRRGWTRARRTRGEEPSARAHAERDGDFTRRDRVIRNDDNRIANETNYDEVEGFEGDCLDTFFYIFLDAS